MARLIVLDTTPLGLAANPERTAASDRCRGWLATLQFRGAVILIPEIADYEVRRELLHVMIRSDRRSPAGIARLNELAAIFHYLPISTEAMRLAAGFSALLRAQGVPTGSRHSIDADAILAAQAYQAAGPLDAMTVATGNVRHLARFPEIDARPWESIDS